MAGVRQAGYFIVTFNLRNRPVCSRAPRNGARPSCRHSAIGDPPRQMSTSASATNSHPPGRRHRRGRRCGPAEDTGLTAGNSTTHDTHQSQIIRHPCTDSTIESHTMRHVATHGIDITGARITVHASTISSTAPVNVATPTGCGFTVTSHRLDSRARRSELVVTDPVDEGRPLRSCKSKVRAVEVVRVPHRYSSVLSMTLSFQIAPLACGRSAGVALRTQERTCFKKYTVNSRGFET